jgi:RNA polymerase-binding protein DksA
MQESTMTDLTKEQRSELEQQIRTRREVLWTDVAQALRKEGHVNIVENMGEPHDRGDASVADMLADLDIAAVEQEAAELKQIELAIIRLTNNTYGVCVDCGNPIGYPRLRANPTASRCVDCQTAAENATNRGRKDITPSM